MTTYPIGRFAIDVPAEMKLVHQWQRLRYAEIEEFAWPGSVPRAQARDEAWKRRLAEIGKLTPPKGKERVIIETREFPGVGTWARGVFYYGDNWADDEGYWLIFADSGTSGIWLTYHGLTDAKQEMLTWLLEIARSYQSRRFGDLKLPPGNWFYTERGAINLPYLEQETAAARFEGHPLGLEIDIETTETHKVEEAGLIKKTMAAMATGFATGLNIDKIRSRKKTVAGLDGEEEVLRMNDGNKTVLNFAWEYRGRKDSGEYPEIRITMDSADGKLEQKLQVWDAVLNSLKPMYGTGR
ncbi:T6SS immunity protein Tli4 family protein [Geobacter anodireducens]